MLCRAAVAADTDEGRKEEARSCIPCHGLKIVHSQRLTAAAWNKELDKMAGWGAVIGKRQALLDYLVAEYGDGKPAAPLEMSGDGTAKQQPRP